LKINYNTSLHFDNNFRPLSLVAKTALRRVGVEIVSAVTWLTMATAAISSLLCFHKTSLIPSLEHLETLASALAKSQTLVAAVMQPSPEQSIDLALNHCLLAFGLINYCCLRAFDAFFSFSGVLVSVVLFSSSFSLRAFRLRLSVVADSGIFLHGRGIL
jgi:hypothetical protein